MKQTLPNEAIGPEFLPGNWDKVRAARVRCSPLSALAPLRHRTDISVSLADDYYWVRWEQTTAKIVFLLLPLPGVEFCFQVGKRWFRIGSRLPLAQGPPTNGGTPLYQILQPQRFHAEAPESAIEIDRLPIRLVHGTTPQPASAMRCWLNELLDWSQRATQMQLLALRCAWADDKVLLLGTALPAIGTADRFWGSEVLLPLGFQIEPDLPVSIIRSVLRTESDELLLIESGHSERIPRSVFQPLTRAGLRLAVESRKRAHPADGNNE